MKNRLLYKKRENLALEAQALGLRVKLKAAENKLREAELHVRYHELKMEIIEFSCRERFEWMKIYSEPNEIEQFMEGFRAKLDEFEKVRFYNYLSENACLEMFMQHESCFSNAIK